MLLKEYVPDLINQNETFSENFTAYQKEIDVVNSDIDDIIAQCFIDTATWGLDLWDEFLNIKIDHTKDYTFRREQIKAKIRGVGTCTTQLLINTAAAFSNGQVQVIEDSTNYHFQVKFVGTKGIPANMNELTNAINLVKPAHLSFEYIYTFNTYSYVEGVGITYKHMGAYTWEELTDMKLSNTFTHEYLSNFTHQQLGGIL